MPYMTQSMSSGILPVIQYYRRQSQPHVSHAESGAFTTDATAAYATANNIATNAVVPGNYRSGQGRPANRNAVEI
ncbi:hypothetical protein V1318_08210 [Lysobacter sp. CCNWLW3]|uniref:hypothetical protein n=1 Tax=unclassified Lysobacter TaxID=2635362 RepID=UPI002FD1F0DF